MKDIIFVNGCVRPDSRTRRLAQHVLDGMEGRVSEIDLQKEAMSPMDNAVLEKRESLCREKDFSDDMFRYARQFAAADTVVIAAPYWDLAFPAMVKIYLEAVTVQGVTFRYSEKGVPVGLCNIKKLVYVTTSGGPIGDFNFGFDYVNALARGLFGIEDVKCYSAQMLDIVGADVEGILAAAEEEIDRDMD